MGCGVSHFEHKEPEILIMDSEQNPNNNNLHDQETKAILPLLSNSYYHFNNNDDDEVDEDGHDEYRSQSSLEEKDYYDLINRELHNNTNSSLKFPGSPSFREYCGFNHHHQYSQGLIEGANDDNRRFVEEPSDHMEKEEGSISKDKISVVVKKKVSRVRRIQSAISRTVLPTKFLFKLKYSKTLTN